MDGIATKVHEGTPAHRSNAEKLARITRDGVIEHAVKRLDFLSSPDFTRSG